MTATATAPQAIPAARLPQGPARFIAYGAPVAVANPHGDGQATIRPQVFVTYYPHITVKSVDAGRSGDRTIRVDFAPESVPSPTQLKEPIAGYLDTDDPLVDYLRRAAHEQRPVSVGIEIARRAKRGDTRAAISPLTPIHALRGCETPDGAKSSMDESKATIRKPIALIDGYRSTGGASDPMEWGLLVTNKDGRIAPPGWRFFAPGDDWRDIGAVIPDTTSVPDTLSGVSGSSDIGTLIKAAVQEAVAAAFAARDDEAARRAQTEEGPNGRVTRKGKVTEGLPHDARTSDGRVNLGSWMTVGASETARWAYRTLTTAERAATNETPAAPVTPDQMWSLTDTVLELADKVQRAAYGRRDITLTRKDASHRTALEWVKWTITHAASLPDITDTSATDQWAAWVTDHATRMLSTAGESVAAHLATTDPRAAFKTSQAPKVDPATVTEFLAQLADYHGAASDAVARADALHITDLLVAVRMTEGHVTGAVYPIPEGEEWTEMTVRDLIGLTTAERRPAPHSAQPAPTAPHQPEPRPAPAPLPSPSSHAPQQATAQGADPAITALIRDIASAATESDLRACYDRARAGNALTLLVPLTPASPVLHPELAAPGTTGTHVRVSDIINRKREALTQPRQQTNAAPTRHVDAQAVADQAATATDTDHIQALLADPAVIAAGATTVTVGGLSGPLIAYLENQAARLGRR